MKTFKIQIDLTVKVEDEANRYQVCDTLTTVLEAQSDKIEVIRAVVKDEVQHTTVKGQGELKV